MPQWVELEQYIERARREWRNVGLAVAVVKGTDILYAGGFGVRRFDESARVTPDTLFQVGSTTKSFTAAALAMLVEKGALKWDDPVCRHLPTFRLSDPWVTRHLTVRDALAHRGGIFDSLYAFLAILDAESSIQQLAHLTPNGPFRDSFCYSNLMYAAAGRILESLSGRSWGDFVRQQLLVPLNMQRSLISPLECWGDGQVTASFFGERPGTHSQRDAPRDANVAMPHGWDASGSIQVLPWRTYDNAAAAGGLVSSAADMANWLILHVNAGCFQGQQILSPGMMRTLHTTQNLHSIHQFPYEPSSESYALGWFKAEFAGRIHLEHGGGMIGFPAYLALLPEERLAVVVLSNGSQSARERLTLPFRMGLHKSVAFWVFDRLLGRPARDWSQELLARALLEEQDLDRQEVELRRARLPHAPPTLPWGRYVGSYEDEKSRSIRVEVCMEEGVLVFKLPGAGAYSARLEHWHQDVFRLRSGSGVADVFEARFVTFRLSAEGRIASLSAFDTTFEPLAGQPENAGVSDSRS